MVAMVALKISTQMGKHCSWSWQLQHAPQVLDRGHCASERTLRSAGLLYGTLAALGLA